MSQHIYISLSNFIFYNQFVMIFTILFLAISIILIKRFFGGTFFAGIVPNLEGFTAIVTGGGNGIGFQTVKSLVNCGCRVVIADVIDCSKLVSELNTTLSKPLASYQYIDLGDLESVKNFAQRITFQKIDFLVNNAGVMGIPSLQLTKSNFQYHYGINYIGHFYLTHLLWRKLSYSQFFRVINVSSITHRKILGFGKQTNIQFGNFNFEKSKYDSDIAYARSKLYLTLFTKAINQIIPKGKGLSVSIHPGIVRTNITRYMFGTGVKLFIFRLISPFYWLFTKNCQEGVQTTLYALYEKSENIKGGSFYIDCKPSWSNPIVEKENLVFNLELINRSNLGNSLLDFQLLHSLDTQFSHRKLKELLRDRNSMKNVYSYLTLILSRPNLRECFFRKQSESCYLNQ